MALFPTLKRIDRVVSMVVGPFVYGLKVFFVCWLIRARGRNLKIEPSPRRGFEDNKGPFRREVSVKGSSNSGFSMGIQWRLNQSLNRAWICSIT
jgi:hypothetical protein